MPQKPQSQYALKLLTNRRYKKRVNVALNGALCINNRKAELISTHNISEGGVRIHYEGSTKLKPGMEVALHLEGIVSNGPQLDLDIYKMQVVYHNSNHVGLRFGRFF